MRSEKSLHSKAKKSPSPCRESSITWDPPPPYVLPKGDTTAKIKENDLEILRDYDTVIIVDDSGSMDPLWGQACRAVSELAVVASRYDKDGIDIVFLNRGKVRSWNPWVWGGKFTSKKQVENLFAKVTPIGGTPTGQCLKEITREPLEKIKAGERCKKISYLVITDGRPSDKAKETIIEIAEQLDHANAVLTQIGIQFIQIGDDKDATESLRELDDNLKGDHGVRDIVDTEPYVKGQPLTGERLTKCLVGGINRLIDRENKLVTTSSA